MRDLFPKEPSSIDSLFLARLGRAEVGLELHKRGAQRPAQKEDPLSPTSCLPREFVQKAAGWKHKDISDAV